MEEFDLTDNVKINLKYSTYKSCSGTILGVNDYGKKSSIPIQCMKIIL